MRRGLAVAALLLGAAAPAGMAQTPDSVLAEATLVGVGSTLIIAAYDSTTGDLQLPAAPIYTLVGLREPPRAIMSLTELRELLNVDVIWLPRQLKLLIRDRWYALPASRSRLDRLRAAGAARPEAASYQRRPGPFGGVTVDDRREAVADLGYSWGRVYARGLYSSVSGAAWSAAANPWSSLWLSYAQSEQSDPRLGARLALRRAWVAAEYDANELHLAGASALGPLVVYASTRDRFAVTWRGSVDVQVGHSGDRSAVRVSFGPLDPSPLAVPAVF